jgi:hypothetical protein
VDVVGGGERGLNRRLAHELLHCFY